MQPFKIAMIQQTVLYGQPEENLRRAQERIAQASQAGCVCAVLPECMDLGWANPHCADLAQSIPGKRSDFLCRLARENKIYLVAGLTEACGDRFYNTAVFINDQGQLLGIHRKINVLNDVEPMFSAGDRLGVYETPFGTVGIDICADNSRNSTVIGQCLGRMGAQLILSPCSWAVRPEEKEHNPDYPLQWIEPYTQLAQQYGLSILGVSNVGPVSEGVWKGWSCIGSSVAVLNRQGELTTRVLPYGEDQDCMEIVDFVPNEVRDLGVRLSSRLSGQG